MFFFIIIIIYGPGVNMPRSFLVKNKRCTSYNVHRSYGEEPEASICAGKTSFYLSMCEYVTELR